MTITNRYARMGKPAFGRNFLVRLSANALVFFIGSQIDHFFGNNAINFVDFPIRSFDKAKSVDTAKRRQRANQTDIRTFRRLNRTHTAIVRMVNVADFKAGAFTTQNAWAQGAETTFMRQFRQRISLVHKLRQLAGTKKFFNCRHNRANINQSLRINSFDLLNGHTLFNNPFHTRKTDTELILQEFADGTQTTVA